MKFRQWPKRDPRKNYFLVPNEVFHIGLSPVSYTHLIGTVCRTSP